MMIVKRGKNLWHRMKRGAVAYSLRVSDAFGMVPGRRAVAAYTRPNILHINITGLGTNPKGPCNGMRDQAEVFQRLYPESDVAYLSHSEVDSDPLKCCTRLKKLIEDGNARGKYTHVIIRGHSFGGAALMFLLNWLAKQGRTITLAILYDPVPNLLLQQFGGWKRPASAPAESLCFTQRNGASLFLVFPTGTPVDGMTCLDVSHWGEEGNLYHTSMISDSRVWDTSLRAMRKAVSP